MKIIGAQEFLLSTRFVFVVAKDNSAPNDGAYDKPGFLAP